MSASLVQIQELANAVAAQAEALATGKVDESAVYAHVRRMVNNVDTLRAWTAHLTPDPVRQGKQKELEDTLHAQYEAEDPA